MAIKAASKAKKKPSTGSSTDRFWSERMSVPEDPDTPRKTASEWQRDSFLLVANPGLYEWWNTTLLTNKEFVGILLKLDTETNWERVERDKKERGQYTPGLGFIK